ncbi:MICOS complex subunit mic19 [Golovinomyces cichoracearum]|uniref:MICOS complex subunit mic19 n=1 Tax=Golovinomyces cichoracearum TaxID=62708 RepID=A0A420JAG6_9PEZI|nr:MICOS complex subunit mic19 [Golovinomyces cichoracearum]
MMGSQSSKVDVPANHNRPNGETVRFSQSMMETLNESSETDSTRSKALELEIQSRVNAELLRLKSVAEKEYTDLKVKAFSSEENNKDGQEKSQNQTAFTEAAIAGDRLRQLGRDAVQGDICELKSKLEKSKQVREVDADVAKAKKDLVTCLTENDRRPLDCWSKVQKFKEEVARLEDEWIQKVVS